MSNPVARFIAYLVNQEEKGYLYVNVDSKFFRIASPTSENSKVVRFSNRCEMQADIDALKRIGGMICIHSVELTPYKDARFSNLIKMLYQQGGFSLMELAA